MKANKIIEKIDKLPLTEEEQKWMIKIVEKLSKETGLNDSLFRVSADMLVKQLMRKNKLERALGTDYTYQVQTDTGKIIHKPAPLLRAINRLDSSIRKTVEGIVKRSKKASMKDAGEVINLIE